MPALRLFFWFLRFCILAATGDGLQLEFELTDDDGDVKDEDGDVKEDDGDEFVSFRSLGDCRRAAILAEGEWSLELEGVTGPRFLLRVRVRCFLALEDLPGELALEVLRGLAVRIAIADCTSARCCSFDRIWRSLSSANWDLSAALLAAASFRSTQNCSRTRAKRSSAATSRALVSALKSANCWSTADLPVASGASAGCVTPCCVPFEGFLETRRGVTTAASTFGLSLR